MTLLHIVKPSYWPRISSNFTIKFDCSAESYSMSNFLLLSAFIYFTKE